MFPSAWKHVQKSLDSSRNMSLDLSGSSGFFIRHKRWQSIQHRWGGTSSKGLGCPATLNVGIWVSASLKKRACVRVCLPHALGFFRADEVWCTGTEACRKHCCHAGNRTWRMAQQAGALPGPHVAGARDFNHVALLTCGGKHAMLRACQGLGTAARSNACRLR